MKRAIALMCLLGSIPVGAGTESKIVVSAVDSTSSTTYIMNPDGSKRMEMHYLDPEVERNHPGFRHSWAIYTKLIYPARDDASQDIQLRSESFVRPYLYSNRDSSRIDLWNHHPPLPRMPEWSPDRRRLAFSSNAAGTYDIYVVDADGSNESNLTEGLGDEHGPQWSPDGATLIFDSNRVGDWEIMSVPSDGGELTNLSFNPALGDMGGRWSPDGEHVVYEPRDAQMRSSLWLVDLTGSRTELAARTPGHFRWSSTGRHLAFDRFEGDLCDVFVVQADGSNIVNVSRNSGDKCASGHFAWSPDGHRLGFVSNRSGHRNAYSCDPSGGDQIQLTDTAQQHDFMGWFPIVPDPAEGE
ncbi:MAG: hypothetical protein HOM68_14580 [Gemmatimonadetes bacterium]|jgi:TolB protein|nr:hypothetical protein [Gemmatimonadota bacterium]MBT5057767.1 hypothetical protein [Gemmatimonadota bacterium]MBT5141321.1 hypothetical protein [Gemmatimonadota bacterium]MBT5590402.1 hypothetical protein [Gemmatimonadota bacterium]MBT5964239.1 hypothetical protein [Gemmatimonadota bacterium]